MKTILFGTTIAIGIVIAITVFINLMFWSSSWFARSFDLSQEWYCRKSGLEIIKVADRGRVGGFYIKCSAPNKD